MPILQTLQHKASRSRLRKRSTVSLRGEDQATVTSAAAADDKRTDSTPPLPCPERTEYITDHHLNQPASSFSPASPASAGGSSPMEGFMFWRKRDPSPARSVHSRTPSAERKPKPILRRRLSKSSTSEDQQVMHQPQAVRFPNSPCATRTSVMPGYQPPPSSFARPQPQQASTPSPQQSPAVAHPANRASSLPPSPAASFPFPNQTPDASSRSVYNTPSPQYHTVATPGSGSRNSTMSRASIVSRSSYASTSYNSHASNSAQLSPAPQAHVPVTPPSQVSHVQPSAPIVPSRSIRRSSRPASTATALPQQQQQVAAAAARVPNGVRPSSVMSNHSSISRGRRSSRPQAPSGSRTRMSIASVSTYAGSSSGHGSRSVSPGQLSPANSPNPPADGFPVASGSNSSHYAPSVRATADKRASSFSGHGQSGAFAFPSTTAAAPATPPKRQTSLVAPGAGAPSFGDDSMPMFNVIPATPQKAEFESAVVEPAQVHVVRRSRSASPSIRTLEDMPEEEEEDEIKPRQLSFGGSAFGASPRLDDAIQLDRSPMDLNLTQLDDYEGGLDSDGETEASHEVHTDDETRRQSKLAPPLEVGLDAVTASDPPPRLPKSPKRQHASLYQAPHDDGKSISRSLAELAALACDLPPLGAELTLHASEAAQRLATARLSADASALEAEAAMQSSPAAVEAPSRPLPTPPARPVEQAPAAVVEPVMVPLKASEAEPAKWTPHHTAQVPSDPLPPSPPFMSYGSLPSLMSNGTSASESVPSSLSHHGSIMSTPASPDAEEALGSMLRQLSITDAAGILQAGHALHAAARSTTPTTPKQPMSDLPSNPQMYGGLGLGLEMPSLEPSVFEATTPTNDKPSFALPSPPPMRTNRMSVAPAGHPHRAAFYGTPQLLVEGQRASFASADSVSTGYTAATHTRHGSISSMSIASDYEESVLHHAEIVAVSPFTQAYVVGRDEARTHEVGVAF